jgi:hypothetical protein
MADGWCLNIHGTFLIGAFPGGVMELPKRRGNGARPSRNAPSEEITEKPTKKGEL